LSRPGSSETPTSPATKIAVHTPTTGQRYRYANLPSVANRAPPLLLLPDMR
jgi:hypothetical protein